MIIKGGPRAKPHELSTHLLRADTNETVRLFEMAGVAAGDLRGALAEMAAIAVGSRCTKPLYHVSISPGLTTILTDAQWRETIDRLESALGMEGHQRAVVLHTKKDRQHAHVVWNRVDGETLKAVHHGHNFRIHEEVARALERDFGLDPVRGVHHEREGPRPERRASSRDSQQEARTGWPTAQAVRDITEAWQCSENGRAFMAALDAAGYRLARGDRKAAVILDPLGGVHGIARRIKDVRAADVRVKLADLDPATLPSIEQARPTLGIERDDRAAPPSRLAPVKAPSAAPEPTSAPTSAPTPAVLPTPTRRPEPNRYASLKISVTQPRTSWPQPQLVPTPPTWARQARALGPANVARPPADGRAAPSPVTTPAPEPTAQQTAMRARHQAAAAREDADLAHFHAEQQATLKAHFEKRLSALLHEVEGEIVAHNGLGERLKTFGDKGAHSQRLAYLLAKREGIQRRELARQEQARIDLQTAQAKERDDALRKRATREALDRKALADRDARQAEQPEKERPGRDGPGG